MKTKHGKLQQALKQADKGQRAYPTYAIRRLIFKVQVAIKKAA